VRARNGSRIVAVGSTASSSAAAASGAAIGSAAASAAPVLAPVTTPSVSAPTTTDPRSKRRRQIAVRLRTDHVSDELLDVIYAFGAPQLSVSVRCDGAQCHVWGRRCVLVDGWRWRWPWRRRRRQVWCCFDETDERDARQGCCGIRSGCNRSLAARRRVELNECLSSHQMHQLLTLFLLTRYACCTSLSTDGTFSFLPRCFIPWYAPSLSALAVLLARFC
jgi:hypothetical protein